MEKPIESIRLEVFKDRMNEKNKSNDIYNYCNYGINIIYPCCKFIYDNRKIINTGLMIYKVFY
jgi:hypothetical protein